MSTPTHATAETYLDEMLQAEADLDFEGFIARFVPEDVKGFGESRFKKDMYAIREDLGEYKDRQFLGELKGFDNPDREQQRTGARRYVWRGIFEKNETLIVVGLHEHEGETRVYEFTYRH